eukprot:g699.t1
MFQSRTHICFMVTLEKMKKLAVEQLSGLIGPEGGLISKVTARRLAQQQQIQMERAAAAEEAAPYPFGADSTTSNEDEDETDFKPGDFRPTRELQQKEKGPRLSVQKRVSKTNVHGWHIDATSLLDLPHATMLGMLNAWHAVTKTSRSPTTSPLAEKDKQKQDDAHENAPHVELQLQEQAPLEGDRAEEARARYRELMQQTVRSLLSVAETEMEGATAAEIHERKQQLFKELRTSYIYQTPDTDEEDEHFLYQQQHALGILPGMVSAKDVEARAYAYHNPLQLRLMANELWADDPPVVDPSDLVYKPPPLSCATHVSKLSLKRINMEMEGVAGSGGAVRAAGASGSSAMSPGGQSTRSQPASAQHMLNADLRGGGRNKNNLPKHLSGAALAEKMKMKKASPPGGLTTQKRGRSPPAGTAFYAEDDFSPGRGHMSAYSAYEPSLRGYVETPQMDKKVRALLAASAPTSPMTWKKNKDGTYSKNERSWNNKNAKKASPGWPTEAPVPLLSLPDLSPAAAAISARFPPRVVNMTVTAPTRACRAGGVQYGGEEQSLSRHGFSSKSILNSKSSRGSRSRSPSIQRGSERGVGVATEAQTEVSWIAVSMSPRSVIQRSLFHDGMQNQNPVVRDDGGRVLLPSQVDVAGQDIVDRNQEERDELQSRRPAATADVHVEGGLEVVPIANAINLEPTTPAAAGEEPTKAQMNDNMAGIVDEHDDEDDHDVSDRGDEAGSASPDETPAGAGLQHRSAPMIIKRVSRASLQLTPVEKVQGPPEKDHDLDVLRDDYTDDDVQAAKASVDRMLGAPPAGCLQNNTRPIRSETPEEQRLRARRQRQLNTKMKMIVLSGGHITMTVTTTIAITTLRRQRARQTSLLVRPRGQIRL